MYRQSTKISDELKNDHDEKTVHVWKTFGVFGILNKLELPSIFRLEKLKKFQTTRTPKKNQVILGVFHIEKKLKHKIGG